MRDVTKATASQTMASRWGRWGVPACALIVLLLVGNAYVVDAKTRAARHCHSKAVAWYTRAM